ncbi:MAG: helix-turn-helix transcriptional regulator [Armatimonadetes bacterium]|nr:helix-turn-helix transcriptional regulator [Armatimonadota bacterium]
MEGPPYPRPGATAEPDKTELAARAEDAEALAERFQALADANRLKVLHLLHTRGELCACELQATLGVTASNLSFHLQVLRHAGFVKARRSGKWILYRLAPGQPKAQLAAFASLFVGERAADGGCCLCAEADEEEEPAAT